jgi:hypothetical protein
VLKHGLPNSRTLLPLMHAGIALALLCYLYLPTWSEVRRRDVAEQQYIEAEGRAGRWPPSTRVGFEPCYFGTPRQITAMLPANLPAVLLTGFLVVPSNTRDHLLEGAPGRTLPSTRMLLYMVLFAAVVALQWYLMARLTSTPRTSPVWRRIVYIAPIACVPLGLALRGKWADLFRIGTLPFWVFLLTGTLLQYWRKRPKARVLDAGSH